MGRFARLAGLCMLFSLLAPCPAPAAVLVRMHTVLGNIDLELDEVAAPMTVANFLSYVRDGDYDGSFIHRSVPGFVIQGGGFTFSDGAFDFVPTDPAIPNEFTLSNLRGTIAMARVGGVVNSATSQWFINTVDNPGLDTVDEGFTVFGRVTPDSMAVVDAIAALDIFDGSSISPAFNTLPLIGFQAGDVFVPEENLVLLPGVIEGIEGQCGDANDDLFVDDADVGHIRRFLADPAGEGAELTKCSVIGSGTDCDIADVVVLARGLLGLSPGIAPVCQAAIP